MWDDEETRGYDVGMVCLNGHEINGHATKHPKYNRDYCEKCGAKAITACPKCNGPLMGSPMNTYSELDVPSFCVRCGEPLPWTSAKLKAASQLADELLELSPAEREQLKASIHDIAGNTPGTELAALRIKKFIKKLPTEGADALRRFAVDVASEIGKKALTGQ